MNGGDTMDLFDIICKTLENDEKMNTENEEDDGERLTFKRDENGVLWSYDSAGKKVGRIFEHGDNESIDGISGTEHEMLGKQD